MQKRVPSGLDAAGLEAKSLESAKWPEERSSENDSRDEWGVKHLRDERLSKGEAS